MGVIEVEEEQRMITWMPSAEHVLSMRELSTESDAADVSSKKRPEIDTLAWV